ncbi:MAG: D-alanine--D-alanine ligase, partial [Clostridia bacterium]|nr:D-alanine--D-alanine ligase [Clostridia bacterium]
DETMEKVRQTAVKAYRAIGCTGLSRVDFFVSDDNRIFLNEINTLPGFTSISMYPKLMANSGIKGSELIEKLINLAFERA